MLHIMILGAIRLFLIVFGVVLVGVLIQLILKNDKTMEIAGSIAALGFLFLVIYILGSIT